MSSRSQTLAAYARQFLKNQPSADEASIERNRILDEGFSQLQEDLKREFETQVDELNHEPECENTLACSLAGDRPGVSRTNDHESFLSLKFDSSSRMVTIACEKPVKFRHLIEVKLVNDGTGWYYAAGQKKQDMSSCGDNIDWIVRKALCALFGVQA